MPHEMNVLQFGEFTLDRNVRQLRRGTEPVPLPSKAFDLLTFMAENSGRALAKSELLAAVWPNSFVEESNLSQNVFLLRKALGTAAEGAIMTLPGRGYQFTARVTEKALSVPETAALPAPDPVPAVLREPARATLQATHSRILIEEVTEEHIPFWRSPVALATVVLGAVALVTAGWLGWQRWEDRIGGPPVQLVIADFEGGTGDPVLDRTLQDALRIDLSQSPFVMVVSSGTIRRTLGEMMHKPDDAVTPALARDLCERTNSQAVLHGSVARSGSHFLLTEEATNCVDGTVLAAASRDSSTREELPESIDRLASTLRQKLGESRRTIARFSVPLFPANTGSVEALEAYSQGALLAQRGQIAEAIALTKQSVSVDPKFTAGWSQLAVLSGNAGDLAGQRQYIQKAYDLRALANEPTRLSIIALYNNFVTGDLYESLANLQTWSTLYPRSTAPWSGLLEVNRELGRHPEAVAAGQHALSMNMHNLTSYYGLAIEQLHSGDARAARATCELALSQGLDGDVLHGVLLRVAIVTQDATLRAAQDAWSESHPDAAYTLTSEASLAQAEGRVLDGRRLIDRAAEAYRTRGLADEAEAVIRLSAMDWLAIGEVDDARRDLQHGDPDPEDPFELYQLAVMGQTDRAESLLAVQLNKHPQGTLLHHMFGPLIRAEIALQAHKPLDAIAELEQTRPYSQAILDMTYVRGMAYLEANDSPHAEAEFRDLLAHAFINTMDDNIPLSWLNLGRALAREHKQADAVDAYAHFFALWAHANGDPPLLAQARTEAAALTR